jgi:hypothetical protein
MTKGKNKLIRRPKVVSGLTFHLADNTHVDHDQNYRRGGIAWSRMGLTSSDAVLRGKHQAP